jgi:hypothetical protein
MDPLDGLPPHYLGAALSISDVHPEKHLDDQVKRAADESAVARLFDVKHGPGEPA